MQSSGLLYRPAPQMGEAMVSKNYFVSSSLTRLIGRAVADNIMPDSVNGNMSEFESDVLSSNLSPVANGGCSLFGKAPDCASEEQGSTPAAHPNGLSFKGRILCYEHRDESSTLSKPTMAVNQWKAFPAFIRLCRCEFKASAGQRGNLING